MTADNRTHPTWGTISLFHVHSSGTCLFRSPTRAHGFVMLRICRADLVCDADDREPRVRSAASIVEVALSPVQFAELITQPNRGEGIACTLYRVDGESQGDAPPENDEIHEAAEAASHRGIYETAKVLDGLIRTVEEYVAAGRPLGVKTLRDLAAGLRVARMRASTDLDYWRQEMADRARSVRAKVAADLHATTDLIVRTMGLSALREKARGLLPTLPGDVIDVPALRPVGDEDGGAP